MKTESQSLQTLEERRWHFKEMSSVIKRRLDMGKGGGHESGTAQTQMIGSS